MYPKILVTYPGALAEGLRRLTRINFLISNPFVGKSSNLLGVDILFSFLCADMAAFGKNGVEKFLVISGFEFCGLGGWVGGAERNAEGR
jgi:hypothetical protein